jgi:hypothetical protein
MVSIALRIRSRLSASRSPYLGRIRRRCSRPPPALHRRRRDYRGLGHGLAQVKPDAQIPPSTTQTAGLEQLEQAFTFGPWMPQNDCALSARTQHRQFAVDPAALHRASCTHTFLPAQKGAAGGVGHVIGGGHLPFTLLPFLFFLRYPETLSARLRLASEPLRAATSARRRVPVIGPGRVQGSKR